MNTGIQRSGATPYGASTTTSPAGKKSFGEDKFKKNIPMIMAAHGVPYVATASISYPEDFMEVPLRPNVVDPLTRKNTGTNTGKGIPQVDVELVDGDYLELTVFPKGFGSENNNALKMGLPGEGVEGIKNFVVETVKAAGGKPWRVNLH